MHKRILSIVLCLAMMMGFAVPAYATDGNAASDDIFIADDVIVSDGEIITSYDEDGNVVITTQSEETEAPAEETEAPAEETEAPAEETEAPAEETEAPAEETEAPVAETEAEEILDDDFTVEEEIVSEAPKDDITTKANFYISYMKSNNVISEDDRSFYIDGNEVSGGNATVQLFLDGDGHPSSNDNNVSHDYFVTQPLVVDGRGVGGSMEIVLQKATGAGNNLVWNITEFRIIGGAKVVIRLGASITANDTITLRLHQPHTNYKPYSLFRIDNGSLFFNLSSRNANMCAGTGMQVSSTSSAKKIIFDGQNLSPDANHPLIYVGEGTGTGSNHHLVVEGVTFRKAPQRAVLVQANEMDRFHFEDCTFESTVKSKYAGGAICITDATPVNGYQVNVNNLTLKGCTFSGNTTTDQQGGAVATVGNLNNTLIDNCTFNSCTAGSRAGALEICAGSTTSTWKVSEEDPNKKVFVATVNQGKIEIKDCKFTNCVAGSHGGAVDISYSDNKLLTTDITVSGCTFSGNKATGNRGGDIRTVVDATSFSISNCTFTNSKAGSNGGSVSFQGKIGALSVSGSSFSNTKSVGGGGAIDVACNTDSTAITSCSFTGCTTGALQRLFYRARTSYTDKNGKAVVTNDYVDKDGNFVASKNISSKAFTEALQIKAQKEDQYGNKLWNGYGSGGAILLDHKHGKVTISGTSTKRSTFTRCETLNSGGAICFYDGFEVVANSTDTTTGKVTMDYLTMDECKARDAGNAIYFGVCTIPSSTLDHSVIEDCTFIKNRTNILENSMAWPGSTMENGKTAPEHNYDYAKMVFNAEDSGGTIRCIGESRVVLTVQNTDLYRNESYTNGGAIYWNANRKTKKSSETAATDAVIPHLTVTNCTFEENIALRDGGAIYCEASINVNGGNYYRNIASRGGAIAQQVYNNSDRKLQQGEKTELILSNTTTMYDNYARLHGGAISIAANATGSIDNGTPLAYPITFQLNGATIRNNVAAENGGGVYFYQPSYPGEDQYNKDNQAEVDTYIKTITIDNGEIHTNISGYGKATKTPAELIAMLKSTADATKVCLANAEGSGHGGGVYLEASKNCTLAISDGHIYSNIARKGNGGGIYMTGKDATCTITGGTVGGAKSIVDNGTETVTITDPTPNRAVMLDEVGGCGGGIAISDGAIINMQQGTDASGNTTSGLVICNQADYQGAGIWLNDGDKDAETNNTISIQAGKVNYNNVISDTATSRNGGGVFVGDDGTFSISEGEINHNSTPGWGGGLYLNSGTASISGTCTHFGKVNYNKSNGGAGIAVQKSAGTTVNISGGEICNNQIYLKSDGKTYNGNGGGIYLKDGAVVNISGGKISNNKAQNGGGIWASGAVRARLDDEPETIYCINVTGGEISNNTAADFGGGICILGDASAMIKGDNSKVGKISNNTAKNGGGVSVTGGAELTVNNGYVTNNTANGTCSNATCYRHYESLGGVGGGVFVARGAEGNPSTFTLEGNNMAIYGNIASFAADDVFSSGENTKLNVPTVKNMNLEGYGFPAVGWVEDYAINDSAYELGMYIAQEKNNKDDNDKNDIKNGKNVYRYRFSLPGYRMVVDEDNITSANLDEFAPNVENAYVCMTLGIPSAQPDVVVVDFGLPVSIDVRNNDPFIDSKPIKGFVTEDKVGDKGFNSASPVGTNCPLCDSDKPVDAMSNFTLDDTHKVTFTPVEINFGEPKTVNYCICYEMKDSQNATKYYHFYASLTVVPATNIYYEDSFLSFTNVDGSAFSAEKTGNGFWTKVNEQTDVNQQQDRPGEDVNNALGDLDADNVYGYDEAYKNCTTYSLGSAMKVTVDKSTGSANNAPTANFTFTGTGFDVVSLTNNKSGCIWVTVKDANNNQVKSVIVSNYYGYTHCLCEVLYVYEFDKWVGYVQGKAPNATATVEPLPETAVHNTRMTVYEYTWIVEEPESETDNALYQVPVIKVDDLAYGEYNVELKVVYLKSQDIQKDGSYTVWLDAIRIYNPAQGNETAEDAYKQDGENNPFFTTVKSLLVTPSNTQDDPNHQYNGVGYVDGRPGVTSMVEYKNQGPNNETYLENGNAVTFRLVSNKEPTVNFQIGAKLAKGSSATLNVRIGTKDTLSQTIETATNMFYKVGTVNWTKGTDGKWKSDPIALSCSTTDGNILSLTDIKVTGVDATAIVPMPEVITPGEDTANVSENYLYAVYDGEVASFIESIFGTEGSDMESVINLSYPTLSFEDEIKYNFYYTVENLDVAVEDMGLITWSGMPENATFDSAENVIPGAIFNEATGEYMVRTNGIPAKNLGDDVYFKVYAELSDGSYVYSGLTRYSAKRYAMERLENSNSEDMKAACVAMLNYGAAAQMHFGYKTDALVNADLTAEQKALVSAYSADMVDALSAVDAAKVGDFAANGGFSNGYPSVSFEGAFAINYYFVPKKTIDGDLTLYCWDLDTYNSVDKLTADNATSKVVMSETARGEYFGAYTGIAAKQIDETVFVAAVYESEGVRYSTGVIPYSVGKYCVQKAANGSETMKAFAAETAVFGHYAKIYFDNLQK